MHYYLIQFLIMISVIITMLCLVASMIELFIPDLVMFMIYLSWNLIMQLLNYSTYFTLTSNDVENFGHLTVVACTFEGYLFFRKTTTARKSH